MDIRSDEYYNTNTIPNIECITLGLKSGESTLDQLHDKFGIQIKYYDDRIVLNYDQIKSHKYRFNPEVRLCRNLILSRDFEILHRSFDRFYNYMEDPISSSFNISDAICEEKLDGSLIGVYHDGNSWCCCTRSMAFAEGSLSDNTKYKTYRDLISNEIDLSPIYDNGNKCYSYIFELMSEYDPHVTRVSGTSMYLLAVRNKFTGEYIDKHIEGDRIGWKLYPREFRFNSISNIMESIKNLPNDEEGYVCRINKSLGAISDWRMKIKNPAHIALSKLKDGVLTTKKIINIIFLYEEDEYLSYNPDKKELFKPWVEVRDHMNYFFNREFKKFYSSDRKEFASRVSNLPRSVKGILFNMYDSNGDFSAAYSKLNPNSVENLFMSLLELGVDKSLATSCEYQ